MKLDLEMAVPEPVPTVADPFAIGWRYTQDHVTERRVPLSEEDLLYPQEDDFVVNNEAHHDARDYLKSVFRTRLAGRPGLRVLCDHLIDFEHPAVRKNLGPDVIVLDGEPRPWNPMQAVFPVKAMHARPLFVIEITSPTTRRKDLTDKPRLFYAVGVPVFVLIDLPYGGGRNPHGIVAFRAGPTEYEPLPPEPNGRVWLEAVEVSLAVENGQVVCYGRDGRRVPTAAELYQMQHDAALKAHVEKARADTETRRAEEERTRADEATRKLAELEAEIRRLRGEIPNTTTPNS